ncbi:MAG: PDZ domain-containing protein [Candidatus Hydrogenedentes bacterium]|nr:PDZ domain-containing protein [Candidatus Hydrogenedentota bacterium]
MLKGLLIRQGFLAVDLVLAALLALVAYQVIVRALIEPVDNSVTVPVAEGRNIAEALDAVRVGDRADYERVVSGGMFGQAGRDSAPAVATGPEPEDAVEVEAPRTLRLWGTTTASPMDPSATAVIENASSATAKKVGTYRLGEPVTDSLILAAVYPRKVKLHNEAMNRYEVLEMEEPGAGPAAAAGTPIASRAGRVEAPAGRNIARVPKDELFHEMTAKGTELVSMANPQMYYDDSGKIAGITSDNLSNIPIARKAGLQSGDVVQSVNGVAIDSQERIAEIFHKFQNASTFRLGILRNGKPEMLTVKLE